MSDRETASSLDAHGDWDGRVLASQGRAHFMQSQAWAASRAGSGWRATRVLADPPAGTPALQGFTRRVPALGTLLHVPRVAGIGPETVPALTDRLRAAAPRGAFAVKLEFFQHDEPELVAALQASGWVPALSSQYLHAVSLDLTGSEEEVFGRFKKRARYEVRAAEKAGVEVERMPLTEASISTMVGLIGATKDRTGAFFRDRAYLERAWRAFDERGQGELYFARHGDEVLAGAFVFRFGATAWYKDGGSVRSQPKIFAPRYLHWGVIRHLRDQGVAVYELGNIPDPARPDDPSTGGLFRFKTAFARDTVSYVPAFELPLRGTHRLWRSQEGHWLGLYSHLRHDYWY